MSEKPSGTVSSDARRLLDSISDGPCDRLSRIAEALDAAEERGRRRGLEEERALWKYSRQVIAILVQRLDNVALITKAEQERLDPRIVIETVVKHDGGLLVRLVRDLSESSLVPRDSGKEGKKENVGRWVLPGGSTGFVEPPAICNACREPLLTCNLFCDDGCPCNSPRGVNVKPAACSLCRTDNCVKPAHRLWEARNSTRLNPALGFASCLPGDRK